MAVRPNHLFKLTVRRLTQTLDLAVAMEYHQMPTSLPQNLSITGMGGLAVLSATHWMRDNISDPAPVLAFALGVMPNLAAAFAMPLILASFVPLISRDPSSVSSRRRYLWILLFTAFGLCGWELIQKLNYRFVFDVYDILATGLGSFLAHLAFGWHARGFPVSNQSDAHRGEF